MLGIYLHIPYCKTLCPYCDFVKERSRNNVPETFVDALCREIAAFDGPRLGESVFLGGGTPSLLTARGLESILEALHARFDLGGAEITLEANPDDLSPELVKIWRGLGINRVSLGVQSFEEKVLRYLGRRHDVGAARRACEWVGAAFETWSLDLIFGAPPIDAWEATLKEAVRIGPPHISAYNLTYEIGTPFGKRAEQAIPDDVALRMFKQAAEALGEYDHYEISNYAKSGHQSLHNLIYWHNEFYAGFGTGAWSYIDGIRARNAVTTDAYLKNPGDKVESEEITDDIARLETLIQHFRLRSGLKKSYYQERFGNCVEEDYSAALDTLFARGLLTEDEDHIWPTPEGYYLNNEIGLALIE